MRPDLAVRPKKSFGQHFLVQASAIRTIVDAARLSPATALLEIGPGPGVLTEPLLADGRPLHAVELDPEACAHLTSAFAHQPHFHLHPGDAVTLPLPQAECWSVVGNLPYNVSTAILARFLLEPIPWERLVFMFQLEVAQKILGQPGEKAYGPLAVLSRACCRLSRLVKLGPGAFRPAPKVDSAVVLFEPLPNAPDLRTRRKLRRLLFRSFAHRRKTLLNNWQGWVPEGLGASILESEGLDLRVRAEAVKVESWLRILQRLEESDPAILEGHDDDASDF